jgi:Uma2 family endonuclease
VSEVEVVVAPPVRVADWEAFTVPEGYRAEIIRGELVVTPGTGVDHGRAQNRLVALLAGLLPAGYESVSGVEWRLETGGLVAMAPQPDLMVVRRSATGPAITVPPLLAVEVLSPSDFTHRLTSGMNRREGKLLDYAVNGLADYLEIDLAGDVPVAIRYELRAGVLVEAARAVGAAILKAKRPFPYSFRPTDLVQ